jgi:hypothetical protein
MDDNYQYYKCLGLMPGASPEKIKSAYRKMVKVWHPDKFQGNPDLRGKAHEKIMEINEAYTKLTSLKSNQASDFFQNQNQDKSPPPPHYPGKFRTGHFYSKEDITVHETKIESNLWFWCLIPIIGLPLLMHLKKKDDISISQLSAKILISACFFLYAGSFLVEAVILGRGFQSTLYWLIAVVYIAIKSRIVIKTNKEKVAFISQLNVLISVISLFWITRGVFYFV